MEPNKERIEAWVAALESDEMQGRKGYGFLGTPQGAMCAAGVGINVCEIEMGLEQGRHFSINGLQAARWYGLAELTEEHLRPPPNLVGKVGDLQALPVEVDGKALELWAINDQLKLTLAEIAQLIRKQYL